ncbi:MAG: isochorismate synthase [Gammaproteobacteria bacterium]|nr:isochorismate synthase [Gammaproteobacteria bacterium]
MIDLLIDSLKKQSLFLDKKIQQEHLSCQYISLELPLEQPITLKPAHVADSFFLSKPDAKLTMLGMGAFLTIKAEGSQRFNLIKTEFSNILKDWYLFNKNDFIPPIAFMAFAFDNHDPMQNQWENFPNTLLSVPTVLIKQENGKQQLKVNLKLKEIHEESTFKLIKDYLTHIFSSSINKNESGKKFFFLKEENKASESGKQIWHSLTEKAIKKIQSGQFDKLVTSRQHSLQTQAPISIEHLVENLGKHYPCCTILSYSASEDQTIVAASPERLITLQHPDIQSDALGGTIFRSKQHKNSSADTPIPLPFFLKQKNNQTNAESSESKKLLKEHHYISQAIYQSLDPLCHTLKMPVSPYLMKLQNLYHLETPIQGKLMNHYDLFDTLEALHPTPAIAGLPSQEARKWLLENEDYQRGWYTGAFGWVDGNKNGDLSVMLRCALISSNCQQLDLFAGAGLVDESCPEAEWLETELKMQTIAEML